MLDRKAFGLAMGFTYAALMAKLAWAASAFHIGDEIVTYTGKMYPGYRPGFVGGLVGAGYGFITGFSMGWFTAWLYDALVSAGRVEAPTQPGR